MGSRRPRSLTISSADWIRNGRWYTQQKPAMFHVLVETNRKNSWTFAHDYSSSNILHYDNFLQNPINMGFKPGIRSTIGLSLGRDDRNRDHAVEFTYLGIETWKTAGSITAVTPGGVFTDLDPSLTVPVYNASDMQSIAQTSTLQSFELNYRVDRRLARDRVLYTRDSTWVREAVPSPLPSLFVGVRVLGINETLAYFASSAIGNGAYHVQTHNNLVGLQTGFDWFYEGTTWRAGVRPHGGAYVNFDNQSTQVQILDLAGNPLVANRNEHVNSSTASFMGGLNFNGSYRISPELLIPSRL